MTDLGTMTAPAVNEAAAALAWARDLVLPALRDAVDTLPEPERRMVGYHRGWNEADGTARATAENAGKGVRPALTFLAARAVGGTAEDAVPGAVAVELVHDFSLIHDDVIDGDALRRHRPSLWAVYGTPAAVLAGDALLAASLQTLTRRCPAAVTARAVTELAQALQGLLRGQSLDVALAGSSTVTEGEYLTMAACKTGALMGGACALGGVLAGASEERVAGLRAFGHHLGLAFQCVDDVLGIWGSSFRSGKPVGADVRARKKSLPVVVALADEGPRGRELTALYARREEFDDAQVGRATELIAAAGGRQAAEREAARQIRSAFRALAQAEPAPEAYRQLQELAALVARRDH